MSEKQLGDVLGMVLAAGFGTRLGRIGEERPKALLPVCDAPLYRYAFALLAGAGITEVVVNTHNMAEMIEEAVGRHPAGMSVRFSREEPEILGTGGGVKAASRFFSGRTVAVVNAKLVTDLDLSLVLAEHRRMGALATMVVRPDPDAWVWGAVELDRDGMVRGVAGLRSPDAPEDLTPYMFTGIALLEPEFLDVLPEGPSCIVRQGYHAHLRAGRPIAAFVHRGYWHEHSTPSRYLQGNFNLLERTGPLWSQSEGSVAFRDGTNQIGGQPRGEIGGELSLSGLAQDAVLASSVQLIPPYRIGPGARIGKGATIGPHVVVGSGAQVAEGSHLSRSVVWDGALVQGRLDAAVVTRRDVVLVDLEDEGAKTGPALGSGPKK